MMERTYENEIKTCEKLGIFFVAYSPMAGGFLSGKCKKDTKYEGDDFKQLFACTQLSFETYCSRLFHEQILMKDFINDKTLIIDALNLILKLFYNEFFGRTIVNLYEINTFFKCNYLIINNFLLNNFLTQSICYCHNAVAFNYHTTA